MVNENFNKMLWNDVLGTTFSNNLVDAAKIVCMNDMSLQEFLQFAQAAYETAVSYKENALNDFNSKDGEANK